MIKRAIAFLLIIVLVLMMTSCNNEQESVRIKKNEVYDWRKIVDGLENKFTSEVFVRLVEYTMNNNLRIEPGKYVWDKDINFEKIIEIFDFASIEETEELIIVKRNTFSIDENEVFDWQEARNHFRYWLSTRAYIKVIEYMRDNNMKIASGEYNLKQSTDYDDAMEIFELEEIINPSLVEIQESIDILNNYNWIDINKVLYFWLKPEDRIDLMVYMYNGDLSIKRGEYIIKQDMSYEDAIQLFEFVTIDD